MTSLNCFSFLLFPRREIIHHTNFSLKTGFGDIFPVGKITAELARQDYRLVNHNPDTGQYY